MLRYTIRDLFWLTVVVALGVLWWGETRQRKSENAELWAKNTELIDDMASAQYQLDAYRKLQASVRSVSNEHAATSAVHHERKRRGSKHSAHAAGHSHRPHAEGAAGA